MLNKGGLLLSEGERYRKGKERTERGRQGRGEEGKGMQGTVVPLPLDPARGSAPRPRFTPLPRLK